MKESRKASIKIGDEEIRIAVASGLGNARKLLNSIQSGEKNYHLIEIMACPGGCIDGGGQPYIAGHTEILQKRMDAISSIDKSKHVRQSHKNPEVIQLYREFLGRPLEGMAHKLLHTSFHSRDEI